MPKIDIFKPVFDSLATDGFIGDPLGAPAFMYLRVSSEKQSDEGSNGIPRQIERCHEAALKHNLRISWDLTFADDFTGTKLHRPALDKLRAEYASPQRRADAIVIEQLHRLSRNVDWHQGMLLDEMKECGLKVVFWKEFSSRIERTVQGAIAQDGMEDAKSMMRAGKRTKARSGRLPHTKPAYGYQFVDRNGQPGEAARKDTYYGVLPDQERIVVEIFERLAFKADTAYEIARDLQERGIKPPGKMVQWWRSMIVAIVKNSAYKGQYYADRSTVVRKQWTDEYGRQHESARNVERPRDEWILIPVPAIVDAYTWELANKALKKNKDLASRNAKSDYLLAGLLKCARCGKSYIGSHQVWDRTKKDGTAYHHELWTYKCSNKPYPAGSPKCAAPAILLSALEDAVWDALYSSLTDPARLPAALERLKSDAENNSLLAEIAHLDKLIDAASAHDEQIKRGYIAGIFSDEEARAERASVKALTQRHRIERDELRTKVITQEEFEARRKRLLHAVEAAQALDRNASFVDRRHLLRVYVDRIDLDVTGQTFTVHGALHDTFRLDPDDDDDESGGPPGGPPHTPPGSDDPRQWLTENSGQVVTVRNLTFQITYSLSEKVVTGVEVGR
jgi:site-specific DNA recombinase